jgi:hypothetical protein
VIAVEKRLLSPLQEPSSVEKLFEVDSHVGARARVPRARGCVPRSLPSQLDVEARIFGWARFCFWNLLVLFLESLVAKGG